MTSNRVWIALGALLVVVLIYFATRKPDAPGPVAPVQSYASDPYALPPELPPSVRPDGTPY